MIKRSVFIGIFSDKIAKYVLVPCKGGINPITLQPKKKVTLPGCYPAKYTSESQSAVEKKINRIQIIEKIAGAILFPL
jgi:hypothetical protein